MSKLKFFSDKNTNKDKYSVLPNKDNPRIIVPLKNFKLFINGFKVQNTASFKNRLIKNSLPLGYPFFKNIASNIVYSTMELENLVDTTRKAINDDRVSYVSVYVGTDRSKNRKLTFLLMDDSGNNIGILKYPIEKESVLFIENEYNTLNTLTKDNFNTFRFPSKTILFDFEYDKVLYQENIFHDTNQLKNELNEIIVNAAVELAIKTKRDNLFIYLNDILNKLNDIKELSYFKESYKSILEKLLNLELPLISIHGDFVIYNMQSDSKRLHLIDWEYFREGLPLYDLFHFVFQGKYQIEKKSVHQCIMCVFNKRNMKFYNYYLSKLNLNINFLKMNKIIIDLFFVYLIDILIFEINTKTELELYKNHFYRAITNFITDRFSFSNKFIR
ncbi:phosphotransferase [Ignavibacteria bacterium 4148-Me]|uniref:phosphotransferase family protein n=1 Tax=Rosettibacter primus TaxID=3111523 RepID=UPI00336BD4FC